MDLKPGDLVACYLTNTSEYESLLQWGVVLETNPVLMDVLVYDNSGTKKWWPKRRWRLLKEAPKTLDKKP